MASVPNISPVQDLPAVISFKKASMIKGKMYKLPKKNISLDILADEVSIKIKNAIIIYVSAICKFIILLKILLPIFFYISWTGTDSRKH